MHQTRGSDAPVNCGSGQLAVREDAVDQHGEGRHPVDFGRRLGVAPEGWLRPLMHASGPLLRPLMPASCICYGC